MPVGFCIQYQCFCSGGRLRGDDVLPRRGGRAWCAEHRRGLRHLEVCEKDDYSEGEIRHTIAIHHECSRAGQAHDAVEGAPSHVGERPHVCSLNPETRSGIAIVLEVVKVPKMFDQVAIALAAVKEVLIWSFPSGGKALFILFTSIHLDISRMPFSAIPAIPAFTPDLLIPT